MTLYARIFENIPDAVLVIEQDGTIRHANRQAEAMFAFADGGLVGRSVDQLLPQRFSHGHAGHRDEYLAEPRLRPMGAGLELRAMRADGVEFPVDVMLSPMEDGDRRVVLTVVRDVTERRKVEQRVQESLHEKDTLLREIHHRVKNNLAVISSLLFLQSTRTDDWETQAMLEESQQRVRSMALVHETLYRSSNLSAVEFSEYARALCEESSRSLRVPGQHITFDFSLESVTLPIDIAIPCGLILNELITNAFKHGFPEGRSGAIRLSLTTCGPTCCELIVQDQGVGGVASSEGRNSLGLTLVQALTKQIDGEFALHSSKSGTRATLRIPVVVPA